MWEQLGGITSDRHGGADTFSGLWIWGKDVSSREGDRTGGGH